MSTPISHALILGGSMAGLLAARALSDVAQQITIIERDEVIGVDQPRRGVPQGRHVHGLLARGQLALETFFPGFTQDAMDAGVPTGDLGELRWFFGGLKLKPQASGCLCISADRPVLEHLVRERVRSLPGVSIRQGHEVSELAFDDSGAVVGATVVDLGSDESVELGADLVIDALGRGSRSPRWLSEHGYEVPAEESIKIDLTYTSRHYRVVDEEVLQGDLSVNPVSTPTTPRGAFFSRVQGDDGRSIISLTGVLGDEAPEDPAGFESWAKSMAVPDVGAIMEVGEPLDEPVKFRFPKSVRRRYDLLDRVPDGLLILGDALCSFNPVYGQGMTVAALEAELLAGMASEGLPDPKTFFAHASTIVDGPWQASAGGDLAFFDDPVPPEVEQGIEFMSRVQAAAARDPEVTRQFMRVAGLIDPPSSLQTDDMIARIFSSEPVENDLIGAQK